MRMLFLLGGRGSGVIVPRHVFESHLHPSLVDFSVLVSSSKLRDGPTIVWGLETGLQPCAAHDIHSVNDSLGFFLLITHFV